MTNVHVVPLVAVSAQHLPVLKPPVGKVTEGPGFAFKPGEAIRVFGESLGQDFQRHVAIELRIPGSIHLPHAPSPILAVTE